MSGKFTLCSGASDGIGFEIVLQLSKYNISLALVARNKERLDAAAKDLTCQVHTFSADVADTAALETVCQAAVTALGGLDIVVISAGNAGPEYLGTPVDKPESFEYLQKVHVHSTLKILQVRYSLHCMRTHETIGLP